MDETKNNKEYIYAYVISFIIILVFFSFFVYKKFGDQNKDNGPQNIIVETNSGKKSETVENLLNSGEYKEVIKTIEQKGSGSLEREEKLKLVYSYLNYGNYFYKEAENSKKAMEILVTMDDDFDVLYHKGYSQEIIKNYSGALDYYNKGLEIKDLTDKSKSILLNQIGHLYNLKGDTVKAFEYFEEAYKLDENNATALSNLGRYYTVKLEFEKAYEFYNKALELTTNLPLKSEISFSLSSIELELNGLKPDIEKSIDYARQSIDYYPSYAMGYVALARGLYMKNERELDKEIETNLDKAIELNPNGYYAYELYALHEIDKASFEKAKSFLKQTIDVIPKDMLLMDGEEEGNAVGTIFFDAMMLKMIEDKGNSLDFIKEKGGIKTGKIRFQIIRNDYGVFSMLKDNEEFNNLLKN